MTQSSTREEELFVLLQLQKEETRIGLQRKNDEKQYKERRAVCSFTAVERRIKDRTTEGELIRTVQWNKSCVEAARLIFPDHEITFVAITRII